MNAVHDPNAVIAAWIDEGPTDLPHSTRRAIATALPTITQRRRRLGVPWREPMNGFARIALLAAAFVAAAIGGVYLLGQAQGPSVGGPVATPVPSPAGTPHPRPTTIEIGTITLTDAGCPWTGNPGTVDAGLPLAVAAGNETDTFGNFGLYKLLEGRTWQEAQRWMRAEEEALQGGVEHDEPVDFAVEVATLDVEAQQSGRLAVDILAPGTYGIVCSSNEPPPGAVFHVYLAGPLEVE